MCRSIAINYLKDNEKNTNNEINNMSFSSNMWALISIY